MKHPHQTKGLASVTRRVENFTPQGYIVEKLIDGSFRKVSGHSSIDACIRSAQAFGGSRRVVRSRDGVVVWEEQEEASDVGGAE